MYPMNFRGFLNEYSKGKCKRSDPPLPIAPTTSIVGPNSQTQTTSHFAPDSQTHSCKELLQRMHPPCPDCLESDLIGVRWTQDGMIPKTSCMRFTKNEPLSKEWTCVFASFASTVFQQKNTYVGQWVFLVPFVSQCLTSPLARPSYPCLHVSVQTGLHVEALNRIRLLSPPKKYFMILLP